MTMPFFEVAEALEVSQSTYFWTGTAPELALVLQRELGVTEDFVPQRAKYMQVTGFNEETAEANPFVKNRLGHTIHCMVAFYDDEMQPCFDDDTQAVNFVI